MSCKRSSDDRDPDYDDLNTANDQKRLKVIEKDNKDATLRKIEQIIRTQFGIEMDQKEKEIDTIDERLYQAMQMMDQLRACVVSAFYSFDKLSENSVAGFSGRQPPIHPTVSKFLGKGPKTEYTFKSSGVHNVPLCGGSAKAPKLTSERILVTHPPEPVPTKSPAAVASSITASSSADTTSDSTGAKGDEIAAVEEAEEGCRSARFKVRKRVVIGNVSKYIPVDKREERDQSTHKWMVYVRGPKEQPDIGGFVKKVWFFLHPSYQPNDLVEVTQPPFHLTRRGWGEFPVRVQLHFRDARNKRVDIIHTLRLDKTYTGLQTLGAETLVDVLIYRENGLLLRPPPTSTVSAPPPPYIQSTLFRCPSDVGGISIPACDGDVVGAKVPQDLVTKIKCESLSDFEDSKYVIFGDNLGWSANPTAPKLKVEPSWTDDAGTSELATGWADYILHDHGSYVSSLGSVLANVKSEPPDVGQPDEDLPNDWFGSGSDEPSTMLVDGGGAMEQDVVEEPVLDDIVGSGNTPFSDGSNISESPMPVPVVVRPVSSQSQPQLPILHRSTIVADVAIQQSPSNGATTAAFIQCTDKSGQMFLVPLATFLKLSKQQPANSHSSPLLLLPPIPAVTPIAATSLLRHPVATPLSRLSIANGPSRAPLRAFQPSVVSAVPSAWSVPRYPVINCVLRPPTPTVLNARQPAIASPRLTVSRSLSRGGGVVTSRMGGATAATIGGSFKQPNGSGGRRELDEGKKAIIRQVEVDLLSGMNEIVAQVVRCYPLVQPNPDRCTHPYCAPSLAAFFGWPVGKRRAAEWQRARSVCTRIMELVGKSKRWKRQDVWTTKQMLTWCRHRGYSPLHPNEMDHSNEHSGMVADSERPQNTPSLSDASELVLELEKEQQSLTPLQPEELLLDVESVEEAVKPPPVCKTSPEKLAVTLINKLPSSVGGDFVRQTAEQIGINLTHEEVCDRMVAPLAEEVMLSAMTQFVEDIMRNALANAFANNDSTSRRHPGCLNVENVASSIRDLPQCDFLTNQCLGTKIHRSQLIKKSDFKL